MSFAESNVDDVIRPFAHSSSQYHSAKSNDVEANAEAVAQALSRKRFSTKDGNRNRTFCMPGQ